MLRPISARLPVLRRTSLLGGGGHNLHPTPLFDQPAPPRLVTVDIPARPMPGRKTRPSIDPAWQYPSRQE